MADEVDKANAMVDELLTRKLASVAARPLEATATGFCLDSDCAAPLPPGQRWCNAECRDNWEYFYKKGQR